MITNPWCYYAYNLFHHLRERNLITHLKRKICRYILYWVQQRLWGFSDRDTFHLDTHLAQLIVPRLKRFKAKVKDNGFPHNVGSQEKWNSILDEMIEGFDLIATSDYYNLPIRGQEYYHNKMTRSLQLFHDHYFDLWW